jgi:hypothetical protein
MSFGGSWNARKGVQTFRDGPIPLAACTVLQCSDDGLKFFKDSPPLKSGVKVFGFGSGGYANLSDLPEAEIQTLFQNASSGRALMWTHFIYDVEWPAQHFAKLCLALRKCVGTCVIDLKELNRWARRIEVYGADGEEFRQFLEHVQTNGFWGCNFKFRNELCDLPALIADDVVNWLICHCAVLGTEGMMRLRLEASLFFDSDVLVTKNKISASGFDVYFVEEQTNPYRRNDKNPLFETFKHTMIYAVNCLNVECPELASAFAETKGYITGVHSGVPAVLGQLSFPPEPNHVYGYKKTLSPICLLSHTITYPALEMVKGMVNFGMGVRNGAIKETAVWVGMFKVIFNQYPVLQSGLVSKDVLRLDLLRRILRTFGCGKWFWEAIALVNFIDRRRCREMAILEGLFVIANFVCCLTRFGRSFAEDETKRDGVVYVVGDYAPITHQRALVTKPTDIWYNNHRKFSQAHELHMEVVDMFSELQISGDSLLDKVNNLWNM